MKKLIYCSTCNTKNQFSEIEGAIRYHCPKCKAIHYQNPKPTATLICIQNKKILLVLMEVAKSEIAPTICFCSFVKVNGNFV